MIIFIFFLLFTNCYARGKSAQYSNYECGTHGRFEYCADGIPGCVIGCHCYPGYYFDTDSKICEPNTKLTKDMTRRLAPSEFGFGGSGVLLEPAPAPALPAHAPGQNADDGDLSDWLYNQFFKTIENQIVNNNKTDDEELLKGTRRSGAPKEPLLSTRRNKKNKKSHKHLSKHDLRKKLLRISEDDSLFESSSSSDSSSSSSGSDESSSLGSWERYEWGSPPGLPGLPELPVINQPDKDPAAHRQIVVYSKKPKPPLPSFIFLPNLQPYYTPLGLPVPPAMPMYPMVPVPPICPAGQTDCLVSNGTTASGPTSGSSTASTPTTTTTTTPTPILPQPPNNPSLLKKALRNGNPFHFRANDQKKPQFHPLFKPPPRHPSPGEFPGRQYRDSDSDSTFMGDNNLQFYGDDMKADKVDEDPPFKYISQLIHKDYNTTTTKPPKKVLNPGTHKKPTPTQIKRRYHIKPGRLDDMTRRRFDPRKNGQDDSYYSTLGRQIASLIRGIDAKGVHNADIKIEAPEAPKPSHPFFSESSFAARTYWERFVRSPLGLSLNNFEQYGSYEDLIDSNEQLFDLENKVQKATSAPPLSWVELENIINTMGSVRKQMHGSIIRSNYSEPSNSSLNVSLLPRHSAIEAAQHENTHHTLEKTIKSTPSHNMLFYKFVRPDPSQTVVERVTLTNCVKPKVTQSYHNNKKVIVITSHEYKNHTKRYGRRRNSRRFLSTVPPKPLHFNDTKITSTDINNNKKRVYFYNDRDIKSPKIAMVGETHMVNTKKYFFDENTNFENWSLK